MTEETEAGEAVHTAADVEGTAGFGDEAADDVEGVMVTELLSNTGFLTLGSLGALTQDDAETVTLLLLALLLLLAALTVQGLELELLVVPLTESQVAAAFFPDLGG